MTESGHVYKAGERRKLIHDELLENLARDTTISGELNEMDSMRATATDWLMSSGCMLHADDMTSPKELFEQMERWNVIRIGQYDRLKDLFIKIHRKDKLRMIYDALEKMTVLGKEGILQLSTSFMKIQQGEIISGAPAPPPKKNLLNFSTAYPLWIITCLVQSCDG
jgi:hypothetical protein